MIKKLNDKIYSSIEKVMRGEEKPNSVIFLFLKGFLYCLSLGYQAALWGRHWAYKTGILQTEPSPIKVISIGNLAVGGRGKTPFALFLTEQFLKADKKIAISTRGYRSQIEKSAQSRALDLEEQKNFSFEEVGDEALLFIRKAQSRFKKQKALVIVGKNRYKSALLAKKLGAKILILDDGFQNRKLFQEVKILMVKKSDFSSKTKFLPRGVLRDLPQRAKEADFIAVEEKELGFALNFFPERKVIAFQNSFSGFKDLEDKPVNKKNLSGKVAVFCAIGDPERFIIDLEKAGLEVIKKEFFPDHWPIKKDFLEKFSFEAQALGAKFLICTEKDAVKFLSSQDQELNFQNLKLALPLCYPELKLKIIFGQTNLEKALHINLLSAIIDKKNNEANANEKKDFTAQAR